MNIKYKEYKETVDMPIQDLQKMVGPGWSGIIERLVNDLFAMGWNGEVHQVKEKFGTLRFYIGPGSEAFYARIRLAEDESSSTCEECGEPGAPTETGWIKTLCEKHTLVRI